MSRNEKTSARIGSIAARAARTGIATPAEIKSMAASLLTQMPNRPRDCPEDAELATILSEGESVENAPAPEDRIAVPDQDNTGQ